METILLANAALALVEKLWPSVQAAIQRGEVSAEQQAELKGRIDRMRSGEAFTGPEWSVRGEGTVAAPKFETFPPRPITPHSAS